MAPWPEAVARTANAPEAWVKWRFIRNVHRAIHTNARKLAVKAKLVSAALLSLLVTVTSLGGYLIYLAAYRTS